MDLFMPVELGDLSLRNRIIMAPMTRSRATADAVPTALMAQYYQQRASAGLIVSEGIAPSAQGLGYCRTPGLFDQQQVDAWAEVTEAVHKEGGLMVAQLMHVGRVGSVLNRPGGESSIAPSAIAAAGEIYTDSHGMVAMDAPKALSIDGIEQVFSDYRQAAKNALAAGFDGVELHCTSGYLPAQFLSTGTNQRHDAYGGSVENRCRFVLQVLEALIEVCGAGRVGMRICPDNPFNDLYDENPRQTFEHLLNSAASLNLAYLHVIRFPQGRVDNLALGRRFFADRLIVNESYNFAEAQDAVSSGEATAVSFGRPFIANPDLVSRWRSGQALADFDPDTLYTPGAQGYTLYPCV